MDTIEANKAKSAPFPLPALDETFGDARTREAYKVCLRIEQLENWTRSAGYVPTVAEDGNDPTRISQTRIFEQVSPVMAAHTMGYALIHAPNDQSRNEVEIIGGTIVPNQTVKSKKQKKKQVSTRLVYLTFN